ncbi:MAG: hypothetical protein ACRDFB_09035 [Rhabdochlamydiaceae bacterium]
MNCKMGDLALVIGGHSDNIGKMVTCIEVINKSEGIELGSKHGPWWRVDRNLLSMIYRNDVPQYYSFDTVVPDKCLMPITPPDDIANDSESDIINTAEEYYANH